MKDTRFIELVNLYIDRQLSPAEAAEFEQEIRSNPRRRQVYQQYCRMHRATRLVYESFRAHAEQQGEAAGAATRPATIARLENRQRQRARWAYATAGLAAAACLTFVVVRNDFFRAPAADLPAQAVAQALPAAAPAPGFAPVATAASPATFAAGPAPVTTDEFVTLRGMLLTQDDYAALAAAVRLQEQRLLQLGQTQDARLSLFDDGVFEPRPTLRAVNNPAPVRRTRAATEFTAFQFQR